MRGSFGREAVSQGSRLWVWVAAGMVAAGASAYTPGTAAYGQATTHISGACMEDVYNEFGQGGGLTCTANDVRIAGVTNINIIDDGCAFVGDTVTFDATFEVLLGAQDRYDIGIYIAQDGGDALTGSCLISILPFQPNNESCTGAGTPFACCTGVGTGTCKYIDSDGTSNVLPGPPGTGACTGDNAIACNDDADCGVDGPCIALGSGIQDVCGDIIDTNDPRNPVFHTITGLTLICADTDSNGLLDVAAGTSWRQPGSNELCLSPLYAFPGGPSKCHNEMALAIPIPIPQTIMVCKELIPSSDPGLFNLQIDGTTESADAGDGACTAAVQVAPGPHTVGEIAGTDTDLSHYISGISCVDQNGPVGSCSDCTSLQIDVPAEAATAIVCTITNTNKCAGVDCDDGNACTDDECDPPTGDCLNTPNYDPATECCDPATGNVEVIDDGDACTDDVCDPATGQVSHTLNYDPMTECCDPATGNVVVIDDGNACTDDACDPATGQVSHTLNYDPVTECCDPATGNIVAIDDGNACTDDACDPATGQVSHTPNYDPVTECCDPATGNTLSIDDGDACTDDACDPATGQVSHTPNYDPVTKCCDPDTGNTVPIDDGDACTIDTCNPATGRCTHTNICGACCLPDGTCEVWTASECSAIPSADFHGFGTACLGDSNGNGIDDVCEVQIPAVSEWGLMVMTLLLLSGIKIKFGWRQMPQG